MTAKAIDDAAVSLVIASADDAPVDVGMSRAGKRSAPDRIEQERHDFFERVRACYLAIAANEPERFVVIDTTRSLEEVRTDITALAELLLA